MLFSVVTINMALLTEGGCPDLSLLKDGPPDGGRMLPSVVTINMDPLTECAFPGDRESGCKPKTSKHRRHVSQRTAIASC